MLLPKRFAIPVVVIELVLGIVIGPEVTGLAKNDPTTEFFGDLGLGMLFFFAGYEIDFKRIQGRPLKLAGLGWLLSLALAYGLGGVLAAAGVVVSFLYTGSAMATTAIGTLIPILKDAEEMKTRFGTFLLAAGAAGEFGPILLVTLILSTTNPLHEAFVLLAFILLAVVAGLAAVRTSWRGWPLLERTIETSGQVAVRLAVVLVFGLVALAAQLGLDLLLGGFVAGIIVRMTLHGREIAIFDSKVAAVGYGLLIPFFFVTSGMEFDIASLVSSTEALAEAADVPRALPGRSRAPRPAPLPRRASHPRPGRARVLLRHPAAARRGDHDARRRRRPHAFLDGRRPRRGGDHLRARLPARRPATAAGRSERRRRCNRPSAGARDGSHPTTRSSFGELLKFS